MPPRTGYDTTLPFFQFNSASPVMAFIMLLGMTRIMCCSFSHPSSQYKTWHRVGTQWILIEQNRAILWNIQRIRTKYFSRIKELSGVWQKTELFFLSICQGPPDKIKLKNVVQKTSMYSSQIIQSLPSLISLFLPFPPLKAGLDRPGLSRFP